MSTKGHISPDKQEIVVSVRTSPRDYALLVKLMQEYEQRVDNKSDPIKFALMEYTRLVREHEMVEEIETDEEVVDILEEARIMWEPGSRNYDKLMKNIARDNMERVGGSMERRTKEDAQRDAAIKQTIHKVAREMTTEEKQQNLAGGRGGGDPERKPASPWDILDEEEKRKLEEEDREDDNSPAS